MATSPRMRWPYPSEGVDPWYKAFSDMVDAQDTTAIGLLEAKNIILSGGGVLSWNATSNLLSWALPIVFNSANSGFIETVAAGSISVPQDGSLGFVRFVNIPTAPVALTMEVADALPYVDIDRTLLLFRRKGTTLYFRNGGVLRDGENLTLFEGVGGVVGVTALYPLSASPGVNPQISLTGIVDVAHGGTGLASGTSGGIPYFSASGVMQSTPVLAQDRLVLGGGAGAAPGTLSSAGALGEALISQGPGVPPVWQAIAGISPATPLLLGTVRLAGGLGGGASTALAPQLDINAPNVAGVLAMPNGGTGAVLAPVAGGAVVSDASGMQVTAAGTLGQPLLSNGAGAPAFGPLNLANASAVTGALPEANQVDQTMGGDVGGTTGAATVVGLQSVPVDATPPTAGQYLGYSGSAWGPVSAASGGGFGNGGIVFYLNYSIAAASPPGAYPAAKQLDAQYSEYTAGSVVPTVLTAAYAPVASFLTPVGDPAISIVPPGTWEFAVYAESTGAPGNTMLRFSVYRFNGTTLTLLGQTGDVALATPSSQSMVTGSVYVPATDVDLTDRIFLLVEAKDLSGSATVTTYYEGTTTVSHLHSTIAAPGGTGVLKVVNGYLQSPASLVDNFDIAANAAIAVTKLNGTAAGAGYILKTNGTAGGAYWDVASATGVTNVTSANALLTVVNGTTTPVLTVNTGTTGSTVAIGNDSRFNPAPTTVGTIAYADGTNWVGLPPGPSTYVLTSNGPGSAPSWQVGGGGGGSSTSYAFRTTAVATSFSISDVVVQTTGASSFTVTLPAAPAAGRFYILKHSGTGVVTLATSSGQTIDDAASVTISAQYTAYTVVSTGSGWILI